MTEPDKEKTTNTKTCDSRCCPLQTSKGFAIFLLGLTVGVFAPWPYQIIGIVILVALFAQAKGMIKVV
jgi:hypothetical protein